MSEWSVLITVAQSDSQPAIDQERSRRLLDELDPEESWVQYPPASGRGHGFETRWWQEGEDAASAAIEATERYLAAVEQLGLDVGIVLIHVTSAAERLTEAALGLDRRVAAGDERAAWNVMLRAVADDGSERRLTQATVERILAALPPSERSAFGREGLVEVRFWIEATDAVDATGRGAAALEAALADVGRAGWTIVRAHATSVDEARRTAYLGVERRVRAADASTLPVVIRV